MTIQELDQLSINTIRTLSIDAVQQAKSGHPGTPMALAPLVHTIWNRVLRFDPEDPIWPNRDRFVLSNGHASMLLWSVLHLTGVKAVNADYERLGQPSVSLDDIRRFRQLDSKAPGHPEYHWVSGVETTSGPLGQGVATSVGMAIGQKWLASRYNQPGFDIFNYRIYAVCGDGCMMEGVASEAASLAGHLGLDNLCWIYDNNHITIEGNTRIAFTEDIAARFLGYGWNVLRVGEAKRQEHKPQEPKVELSAIDDALNDLEKAPDDFEGPNGYGKPNLPLIETRNEVDRLRSELAAAEARLAEIEARGDSVQRLTNAVRQAESQLQALVTRAETAEIAAIAHRHYGWEIPWSRISNENKRDFRNHASVMVFKSFYIVRSIGQIPSVEALQAQLQLVGEKLVALREHLSTP
jgi:transketolase N-terminal domain/subunit